MKVIITPVQQQSCSLPDRSSTQRPVQISRASSVLVVWKLDRLGRSLAFLIDLIDRLGKGGAGFRSLSDAIDTTTAGGKLTLETRWPDSRTGVLATWL
jgi:DNA invertase Pin-like site-specific DNA recombinase